MLWRELRIFNVSSNTTSLFVYSLVNCEAFVSLRAANASPATFRYWSHNRTEVKRDIGLTWRNSLTDLTMHSRFTLLAYLICTRWFGASQILIRVLGPTSWGITAKVLEWSPTLEFWEQAALVLYFNNIIISYYYQLFALSQKGCSL